MKIKVCGLKEPGNIAAIAALEPDYAGFICYERSPRFIGDLPAEVVSSLRSGIRKTGVFVNAEEQTIMQYLDKYSFDAVQLHGSESPGLCLRLKSSGVQVIKAFGIDEHFDFAQLESFLNSVDIFLFDTKTSAHGGSGKVFNWDLLQAYQLSVPFFLSGGIGPENAEDAAQINHPRFYGVDLNSRFETAPGYKDVALLRDSFKILKHK